MPLNEKVGTFRKMKLRVALENEGKLQAQTFATIEILNPRATIGDAGEAGIRLNGFVEINAIGANSEYECSGFIGFL